jgi:CBS domain-containing protein
MIATRKPLLALTASDLMTPAVLVLPEDMGLPAAARLLGRQQVSGAPVVDDRGRCTGVLSTTDFMRWAEGAPRGGRPPEDVPGPEWQLLVPEELSGDRVRAHMTPDPVTVPPDTPLVALARMMFEAHIHRLIVVDAEGRPTGVVTTTDVLAALVRAEEEAP